MKKDLQKFAVASIIVSFAVMTGCDQKNNNWMGDKKDNGRMMDQKQMDQQQKRNNQSRYSNGGYNTGC